MKKIAITGKIGSGKTTLSKIIKSLGYKVFESDEIVKSLLKTDLVKKELIKNFSKKIKNLFRNDDEVNLKKLSDYVFSEKKELEQLEKIIHPLIKKRKEVFLKKNCKDTLLFFDIPLLFEKKMHKNFDYIIYAYVKSSIQKKRVLKRKNMNEKKLSNILKIQSHNCVDLQKFISLKIDTENDRNLLKKKIKDFLQQTE